MAALIQDALLATAEHRGANCGHIAAIRRKLPMGRHPLDYIWITMHPEQVEHLLSVVVFFSAPEPGWQEPGYVRLSRSKLVRAGRIEVAVARDSQPRGVPGI